MPVLATDPPVSEKQRRAMFAAAGGHSALGIPKKVGQEFVGKDDLPKTLYVNRPLENADAFLAWARAQGFAKTLEADDLHVTVAFSKKPVDWSAAGDSFDLTVIPRASEQKNGARSVEQLGDEGAVVLRFESPELSARWQEFVDAGARWDYPTFQPHVTITYEGGDVDLAKVEPYDGPLVFGPERFEEVKAKVEGQGAADNALAFDRSLDEGIAGRSPLRPGLAFDRESVRTKSEDGHLHVATTHISKANICPYLGREIPDYELLGLDPDKIYKLYRDPEELAKAAPTFNNLPLLSRHVAVTADDHPSDLVIGSTGSHATFNDPFLDNSLVIWRNDGIRDVEDETKKELSSAYRYLADMTPGEVGGEHFDGRMRGIKGNHVALVKEGRAGADVVVGDSKEELPMAAKIVTTSRRALMATGAVIALLTPKLAKDAKLDPKSLGTAFDGVTAKNYAEKKPGIVAAIKKIATPLLAKDAGLDDVTSFLDKLDKKDEKEEAVDALVPAQNYTKEPIEKGAKDDGETELRAYLATKGLTPEDIDTAVAMVAGSTADPDPTPLEATDADPDKDKDKDERLAKAGLDAAGGVVTKKAMDAAIKLATKQATDAAIKQQSDLHAALNEVKPYVGEMKGAFDSAEAVKRAALKVLGFPDADTAHESALSGFLAFHPKADARAPGKNPVAMDAAGAKTFGQRFPGASNIGRA